MGYVAAGYIAVFGTISIYAGWAIVQSRRAAARVLAARGVSDGEPSPNKRPV